MSERYDCHTHIGVELGHYLTGAFPNCQHYCDLCRDLDEVGIDKVVVFPMVTHLNHDPEALAAGRVAHRENALSRFPYEFENRHFLAEIYDLFRDLSHRAVPLAMIDPSRQTEQQLEHVAALAERYPLAGLKLQGTMLQSPVTDLPGSGFLDLAADRNWPVLIHSAVHPDDPWSQVSEILEVVEAWPQVRFNVAHTLRFDAPQLARLATLPNAWFDVSAFCIHCDLATEDSVVVAPPQRRFKTDYADPPAALAAFAAAYPERILWGSDAPYFSYVAVFAHPDGHRDHFDLRSSMRREAEALAGLSNEMTMAIASSNPRAWLYGERG